MYKNIIVHTADIHWCDNYREEIINPFLELKEYIKKEKPKYVVFAGDFFDRRINNDENLFIETIGYLIEISNYAKHLVIIKGTQSHDNYSLSILKEFNKIKTNIHYYDTLTVDEIDGDKWLLIPEEYPEDPISYYKDIYKEKIDYIAGHGELEGAMLHSGIDNRKLKGWKFNVPLLETTGCKWSMWGHIHKPQSLSKKTFYSGSLARWRYGEEEDKGFRIYNNDENTTSFIKIHTASEYKTYKEEDLKEIIEKKEINKYKNINIRIAAEKDSEIVKEFIKTLDKEVDFLEKKVEKVEINNKILYENIQKNSYEDQFKTLVKTDLENKYTKKQKELLESSNMNNFIIELSNKMEKIDE